MRVEKLERRTLLAGDISVDLVDVEGIATLLISGDSADNSIIVRGQANGTVEVQGVLTTVNQAKSKRVFENVAAVEIDMAAGNDRVKTLGLVVDRLMVRGGSGDDTLQIERTRDATGNLALDVHGDESTLEGFERANGDDTITVSHVELTGASLYLTISGDSFTSDGLGGRDQITLSQVSVEFDWDCMISILEDPVVVDPGNTVTVEDVRVHGVGTAPPFRASIMGSPGDDQFSIRNIDIQLEGEYLNLLGFEVTAWTGNDVIQADNLSAISRINVVETVDFGPGNASYLSLWGDTVRASNIRWEGGSTIYLHSWETWMLDAADILVFANDADLRNVELATHGWGNIYFQPFDIFEGNTRDNHVHWVNVTVASDSGQDAGVVIETGGGDDEVSLVNVTFEMFSISMQEGNDVLSIANSRSTYSGSGFNAVVDLGDGDDSLTALNNSWHDLLALLGSGNDTAKLNANSASGEFAIDGGQGLDALVENHNAALDLIFENFEL